MVRSVDKLHDENCDAERHRDDEAAEDQKAAPGVLRIKVSSTMGAAGHAASMTALRCAPWSRLLRAQPVPFGAVDCHASLSVQAVPGDVLHHAGGHQAFD